MLSEGQEWIERTQQHACTDPRSTHHTILATVVITARTHGNVTWRMQTSAKQPQTLRPSQPNWAASPPASYDCLQFHRLAFCVSLFRDSTSVFWELWLSSSIQDTPCDFYLAVTWPCSFSTLRHVNRNSFIIIIIIIIQIKVKVKA